MARLIPVCGHPRWVFPARPPFFTIRELQELLRTNGPDSFVELICDFKYGSYWMLASEDARLNDLPVNESASLLACREVRGNVLLVTPRECNDLDILWDVYCTLEDTEAREPPY